MATRRCTARYGGAAAPHRLLALLATIAALVVMPIGADAQTDVAIDIKPNSDPSSFSCTAVKTEIPVALLSDAGFDATTADPNSVRFGKTGNEAAEVHQEDGEAKLHLTDVNRNGLLDAVFHFRFGETGFSCDDLENNKPTVVTAHLTGTADESPFAGSGELRLVRD